MGAANTPPKSTATAIVQPFLYTKVKECQETLFLRDAFHSNSEVGLIVSKESTKYASFTLLEDFTIFNFIILNNLSGAISEVERRVARFFPEATIKKELHTDPEEGGTQLFLNIQTTLSVKEAFKVTR